MGTEIAEEGEWNWKDATLSDVTAEKEYGVARDFIVRGIRAGSLEYRDGSMWGNPYLRILRSQLELYITAELGADYLAHRKTDTALRKVNRELAATCKKPATLEAQKAELQRVAQTQNRG